MNNAAGCQLLTPVILATQEAEIRSVKVRSQPGQTVCKILYQKNPSQKKKKKRRRRRMQTFINSN
jgi:translation initiation factor IF-3